jgi:carbon storage regulator
MLCLTRKIGERIRIGDDIWVAVIKKRSDGKLTIGVEAPRDIPIQREELIKEPGQEKPKAA